MAGADLFRVWLPAAGAAVLTVVDEGHAAGVGITAVALVRARRYLRERRFRLEYIEPTLAAMSPALGLDDSAVRLYVDPKLGNLTPRLAKPLSPAEQAVRRWYGEHVEPRLRWLPDRAQRGMWAVQRKASRSPRKPNCCGARASSSARGSSWSHRPRI
jgi:hypothetical protein